MIDLRASTVFFLPFFFVLLLVGCGKKTMPVPPQTVVPESITDLQYALDQTGVTLTWSFPGRLENGERLSSIENFRLSRAMVALEEYCTGCPLPFSHVTIEGGRLADSEEKRIAIYQETDLQKGHRYFFKVQSRSGWWSYSGDSNVIFFDWDSPPNSPFSLDVKSADSALYLTWQGPEKLMDGTRITDGLSYQLYRSDNPLIVPAGADDQGFLPLGGLIGKVGFVDKGVINGKAYYYFVRAFRSHGETLQGGAPSQIIRGVPKDVTPPSPPLDVVAVKTVAGIALSWSAAQEKDVAGYRIYKRSSVSPDALLIGEVAAPNTVFTDKKIPGETELVYFVTAVDYAEPPNESKQSSEVVFR